MLDGEEAITPQQVALLDLTVKQKLLVDSLDAWLLSQKALVDEEKKAILPVLRERQALADGLAKYLGMLELERRERQAPRPLRLRPPEALGERREGGEMKPKGEAKPAAPLLGPGRLDHPQEEPSQAR